MTACDRSRQVLCAIDTSELEPAIALARSLVGLVGGVKLGLQFYTANGPAGVRAIAETGLPIFLDLKFNDIPNTVAGAVRAAAVCAPFMLTVHASGGAAMMRAAGAASLRAADAMGGRRPKVLAVTVLTSFDESDLSQIGVQGPIEHQVRRMAALAQVCGLDGVVASAHELAMLRAQCGQDFLMVVPGIRPGWSSADDQKRIVTPPEALAHGADYLVIGRPITRADDPRAAAKRIGDELAATQL